MRAANAGDSLISPAITVRLLEQMTHRPGALKAAPQPAEPLTPRELDVVRRLARGRTNAEIAQDLFLSVSTVKAHLAHIQTKLDVRNRPPASKRACLPTSVRASTASSARH
ncbi:response regulator transcription factor [Streptomyces luteolus]|uniref:response regulator transcription factor n=1 Tax=Streptomyces luteolus TaxID=3043615 RepID=UPI0032B85F66